MPGYQHAGPAKGECYGTRPTSPGVPTIEQFHGMLKDLIKRFEQEATADGFEHHATLGLESALHLFEGYFGYFGRKEEK